MLCADLVDLQFRDKSGRTRYAAANLEDISISGACVQMDTPIPLQAAVQITYPGGVLPGRVCYCIFREIGYFIGVEFDPGHRWSQRRYRPQHLVDPRRLTLRAAGRARTSTSPTVPGI